LNVADAVARRMSTRAFRDEPVPEPVVRALIDAAKRAPSGGNLQPWHVYAVGGSARERLVALVARKLDAGERETPEYAVYPPGLWEPLRSRRREAGELRYAALGVPRDRGAQQALERLNYRFFGAPVGLFFCVDRRAGPPQWSDLGMYMQTFMLLAVERGLATCPQEVWSNWPKTLAEFLQLPAHLMVFAGMSLGYADETSPFNARRTGRAAFDEFATMLGS